MAYGANKGVQPGELNVPDFLGFAVSSSLGVLAAIATDFFQKGDASAIFAINVFLNENLGQDMPLWWVMLALLVVGGGAVFIFEPTTKSGSFSMGVGLLAAVMAAMPVNSPGGISSASFLAPTSSEAEPAPEAALLRQASVTGVVPASLIQRTQAQSEVQLTLSITFPGGLPEDLNAAIRKRDLKGRLHDYVSGSTWDLFRTAGGSLSRTGNRLVIRTAIPVRGSGNQAAQLKIRVEAAGYEILTTSRNVRQGERLVNWNVRLKESNQPLFLQRLQQPYDF